MSLLGYSRQMPAVRPIPVMSALPPESDAISSGKRNDATCQKGKSGESSNYLDSPGEHRRWNSNTERLSGLEVDDHLVFCRCLHW